MFCFWIGLDALRLGASHGHHHARICGLGPDVGAVAIEPVVQQLR